MLDQQAGSYLDPPVLTTSTSRIFAEESSVKWIINTNKTKVVGLTGHPTSGFFSSSHVPIFRQQFVPLLSARLIASLLRIVDKYY